MKSLIERLKDGEILVCDGAMGTSLQAAGLEPGCSPEEWNISNPEAVKNVHKGFIAVGSDMITTNTFGAEVKDELNKRGVEIAKAASAGKVYVLGDIGPTGKLLKPLGPYSEEDFYELFSQKAKILAAAGIDAFIIETMSALDELKIAVSACKAAANLPVIATMAFTAGQKGYRTMMGVSVEQAASMMLDAKCDVIGSNCGCGSRQMVEIMKGFREALKKARHCEERSDEAISSDAGRLLRPDFVGARNDDARDIFLIAQPNAGLPKLVGAKAVFDETPADFSKSVSELVKLGINIIGGCCGTTAEHIHEIPYNIRISRGRP